jgi:hypothetical protein
MAAHVSRHVVTHLKSGGALRPAMSRKPWQVCVCACVRVCNLHSRRVRLQDPSCWHDPITHERLVSPVLASDGITYSRAALVAAMTHDPLHRSPVTGEVLRPTALRNRVLEPFLIGNDDDDDDDGDGDGDEVLLWPPCVAPSPLVVECTFRLSAQPSPEAAGVLLRLGLDTVVGRDCSRLAFHVQAVPAGASMVLVHPPPPEELWDTCVALASALHIRGTFRNPWCLAGATVVLGASPLGTVETLWLRAGASGAAATAGCPPAPPRP